MGYEHTFIIKPDLSSVLPYPVPYTLDDFSELLNQDAEYYSYVQKGDWAPGGIKSPFVVVTGKCYDWEDDLSRIAARLKVPITIYGWGENEGHIWVCYTHPDGTSSGKLDATVVWPPDPKEPVRHDWSMPHSVGSGGPVECPPNCPARSPA